MDTCENCNEAIESVSDYNQPRGTGRWVHVFSHRGKCPPVVMYAHPRGHE